jgi:cyanophycinase
LFLVRPALLYVVRSPLVLWFLELLVYYNWMSNSANPSTRTLRGYRMPTQQPGAVALLGSGEYTSAMNTTDQRLLATIAPAETVRIALFATASALEPGSPERWNSMGQRHFEALGAQATPIWLHERTQAFDTEIKRQINSHSMAYFSGGSPDHVVEVLHDTPAWQYIRQRWQDSMPIAGCSAGAMMLGGYTLSVRAIRNGEPPRWRKALGLVEHLAILPHFDRMRGFMSAAVFEQSLAAVPGELYLVGIDEDTALLWLSTGDGQGHWEVSGRQTVTLFDSHGQPTVYASGARVPLPNVSA